MKKKIKMLAALLTVICLMSALIPSAGAVKYDERFTDKTWDDVIADYIEEYGIDPNTIALGYTNLVTGETHYLNGDKYMVSGSLYKIPLNMYFCERISSGEMSLDTSVFGVRYSTLLSETIVHSSNDMAKILWSKIGTYHHYREEIAQYMGVDPVNVDAKYYENNFFTPEQMIYCLTLLYNEQDRFPYIIDQLLQAEPSKYFRRNENRFEIAHKYGYLVEGYDFYLNDSAIIYTDEPIAIVMFTANSVTPYDLLSSYCTLMCDYAQYSTAARLEKEQEEAALAAIEQQKQEQAQLAANEPASPEAVSPVSAAVEEPEEDGPSVLSGIVWLILAAAAAAAAWAALMLCRKRFDRRQAAIAVCIAFAAAAVSILASGTGTLFIATGRSPGQSAAAFFDCVRAGNYDAAYKYVYSYSSLGLENELEDEAAELMWNALRDSFECVPQGSAKIKGSSAKQDVLLTSLDLSAVEARVRSSVASEFKAIVENMSTDEIYGPDGEYRHELAEQAYLNAVRHVLEDCDDCIKTTALSLEMRCSGGTWQIYPSQALLSALLGSVN